MRVHDPLIRIARRLPEPVVRVLVFGLIAGIFVMNFCHIRNRSDRAGGATAVAQAFGTLRGIGRPTYRVVASISQSGDIMTNGDPHAQTQDAVALVQRALAF